MKKVSLFNKIVAVIAAVALILAIVNTVLLVRVNNSILFHVSKNAGAINSVIGCLEHDNSYACTTRALNDSKRDMNERVTN